MTDRRVVVTGSSGFIGGHVVERLIGDGCLVLGVDIAPAAVSAAGFTHVDCDIRNGALLTATLRTFAPQAVVHLAARTDLVESDEGAYSTNTAGTRTVLRAARACGAQRFLHVSSQLVCRVGYAPRHDQDFTPNTAYGRSKAEGERICREEDGGGGAWCILRPTTIWGPRMAERWLPFFRLLRRGLYFNIDSKPLLKSYGYVGNTAHQISRLLSADRTDVHGKVFYLADYEPVELGSWADAFAEQLHAPRVRTLPRAVASAGARIGDVLARLGVPNVPLNSFRLHNILTEYLFDLRATQNVCGPLPYTTLSGIVQTSRWLEAVL